MAEKIKTVTFKVDLPRIFNEIARNPSTEICRFPLQVTLQKLGAIAQIAIDNEDIKTLEILASLCIVDDNRE